MEYSTLGQVPPKSFLPSSPYGASPAANVLSPSQPAAQNAQTPLLPSSFTDPGTLQAQTVAKNITPALGGSGGGQQNMNRLFGRGLFGLLLLLLASPWVGATTVVTGKIQDLGTGNVTSVFVRFWLRGCQGAQPRVNGTALLAPTQGGVWYKDFIADANGNISGTVFSTRDITGNGNGEIECPSSVFTATWYGLQIFFAGKGGPETPVAAKNGVTLNIMTVTPLNAPPIVIAPNGDTVYLRLDGGNSPATGNLAFTGTNTHSGAETFTGSTTVSNPCTIASVYYVEAGGCYATIDAAVAAVPSFTIANSPSGATEAGNLVTITTTTAHGFSAGQTVFVSGVAVNGYNGEWSISNVTTFTFTYLNCIVFQGGGQGCTTGLGASGSGTAAPTANVIIPVNYYGPEVATCSNLDNAGNALGEYFALNPQNIYIEDLRGTNKCMYNIAHNANGLQSNPTDISLWRRDTSPNLTSSNIVTDMQVTGTIPNAQAIAGGTFEVDVIGNVTSAGSAFVQATNGQWAERGVGSSLLQIMGTSGGGGIDRTWTTTNIIQGSGIYAFDPKNNSNPSGLTYTISTATESVNTVTITTVGVCAFTTGMNVSVAGVTNAGYNGSWVVLAPGCNGGSTFTYTNPSYQGLASSGSGTTFQYGATIQDSYALVAAAPSTGMRNNYSVFSQGNTLFGDNFGVDVMNAGGSIGPTGVKLLRFGGDASLASAGVNQWSTPNYTGVPYKFFVSGGASFNWAIGASINGANTFEITPSTVTGGNSFTTPLFTMGATTGITKAAFGGSAATPALVPLSGLTNGFYDLTAGVGIGVSRGGVVKFAFDANGTLDQFSINGASSGLAFCPAGSFGNSCDNFFRRTASGAVSFGNGVANANGTLTLGVLALSGATSGTATLTPPAIAGTLTNAVVSSNALQAGVAGTAGGVLGMGGSTSGVATFTAPAVAGTLSNAVISSNAFQAGAAGGAGGILGMGGSTSGIATFTAPPVAGTVLNPIVSSNAIKTPGITVTNLLFNNTAPTIAGAGCGGSGATISANNGTAAFSIGTGTTPTSACTVTMPAATTGWVCDANTVSAISATNYMIKQTGAVSTTSVVLTLFTDAAATQSYAGSDTIRVHCSAY